MRKRYDFSPARPNPYAKRLKEQATEIPELTEQDLARAIPASVRGRIVQGRLESGEDVAALRRFVGFTQAQFAQAMGISVRTLGNWEQGRRQPRGPALALLRIAARHPRILRENFASLAREGGATRSGATRSNEVGRR